MLAISHERKDEGMPNDTDLILTPGTWIPAVLETTLNSEIEGYFTLKTRKPVYDSVTGQQVVIPQGQAIVARDTSSALLFGNERIPTFAVSLSLPGGRSVELGDAPIMDATGTNGLTGEVNNHIWRLVWTIDLYRRLAWGATGPPGRAGSRWKHVHRHGYYPAGEFGGAATVGPSPGHPARRSRCSPASW